MIFQNEYVGELFLNFILNNIVTSKVENRKKFTIKILKFFFPSLK